MIEPSLAPYMEAPDTLVGTAWAYFRISGHPPSRLDAHYVEVVAVIDGRALVVSRYDNARPMPTWWVHTENLLAETEASAFRLIGKASDFTWVRQHSRLITSSETSPFRRMIWTVQSFFGVVISLHRMRGTRTFVEHVNWLDIAAHFRTATEEDLSVEMAAVDAETGEGQQLPEPARLLPVSEPPAVEDPGLPRRNVWERLSDADDD